MNFLKVTVIASLIACLIFTVVVLILNCMGVLVSDTLIQYFFTVFGIELGSTAIIKVAKYIIDKQKVKDKIKILKDEGLPVDKADIISTETNDDYSEDGVFYG